MNNAHRAAPPAPPLNLLLRRGNLSGGKFLQIEIDPSRPRTPRTTLRACVSPSDTMARAARALNAPTSAVRRARVPRHPAGRPPATAVATVVVVFDYKDTPPFCPRERQQRVAALYSSAGRRWAGRLGGRRILEMPGDSPQFPL